MVSIGRNNMPDKTPSELLKAIDSMIEKQDDSTSTAAPTPESAASSNKKKTNQTQAYRNASAQQQPVAQQTPQQGQQLEMDLGQQAQTQQQPTPAPVNAQQAQTPAPINPATGKTFDEGAAEGQRKEAERQAVEAEKQRKHTENVVEGNEAGRTQQQIDTNESKEQVAKRREELQAESNAKRKKAIDSLEYGKTDEQREAEKKEAEEARLERLQTGENVLGDVAEGEELTAWERARRGVANIGRSFKRGYEQSAREQRENAIAAGVDPEEYDKSFKNKFKDEYRKNEAERKVKRMEKAKAKREERLKKREQGVFNTRQDRALETAREQGTLDKETESTLKNLFGSGIKAGTRNKVVGATQSAAAKARGALNEAESNMTASHPRYRQEGARDLVDRFTQAFGGTEALNTVQGRQWLESLEDGVIYAGEGSATEGMRVPGIASLDASRDIWERILTPEELAEVGRDPDEFDSDLATPDEIAAAQERINQAKESSPTFDEKPDDLEEARQEVRRGRQSKERLKVNLSSLVEQDIIDQDSRKTISQLTGGDENAAANTAIFNGFASVFGPRALGGEKGEAFLSSWVNAAGNAKEGTLEISANDPARDMWQALSDELEKRGRPSLDINIASAPQQPEENTAENTTEDVAQLEAPEDQLALPEGTRQGEDDDVIQGNFRELTEGEQEQQLALPEGRTPSSEEAPTDNFDRPKVREAQNKALSELAAERVIDDKVQDAITTLVNTSTDMNTGRNELARLMSEFGTDREKWNDWAKEQRTVATNYSTRTPIREAQNEAIKELPEGPQNAVQDILGDAEDKNEARTLIQNLIESFGTDSQKWSQWLEQYQENQEQLGPYDNALRIQEGAFQASGDGKFAKSLLNRFDSIIKSLAPTSYIPLPDIVKSDNFFYKSSNSEDIKIRANHILKGLDDFLGGTATRRPPLRIDFLDKQETDEDEVYSSRRRRERTQLGGHAGGKGWSGDHLVPMYRTVHRKIPRELILRAIRWVNPANFFKSTTGKPITEISDDDWRAMDREELIKNITTLNEYREESLVIANRYDQMISLIEQGNTPYTILWDDPDKWMTLNDRMDRAQDLKTGTANWEDQLDKTALQLRKIFGEEKFNTEDGEKSHFGLIDDLFDEDKGRIPFFKDITKKDKPWLRRTRGTGRFGEPEETRRVVAEDAEEGIRAARYQLPSIRETLNPTEQELRSDEFREIMLQAPIYQGIRMPTEEQLRDRGQLEMLAEQIREAAPNYSSPDEAPLLRRRGGWQEQAGVDATTVRSTRFVAETLEVNLDRERNIQHDRDNNAERISTRFGDDNQSQDTYGNNVEELHNESEYFTDNHGRIFNYPREAPLRPLWFVVGTEATATESARTAFNLDRDLPIKGRRVRGLNSSPSIHEHSHEELSGHLTENFTDVEPMLMMTAEEIDEALSTPEYRESLYKAIFLDIMTGNTTGESPNETVSVTGQLGFSEIASGSNQWVGINTTDRFQQRNNEGERVLFPWQIFKGTRAVTSDKDLGFGEMLPYFEDGLKREHPEALIEENTARQEIGDFIDSIFHEDFFDSEAEAFNRGRSEVRDESLDDMWDDFAGRIMTDERYASFKEYLKEYMVNQVTLNDNMPDLK